MKGLVCPFCQQAILRGEEREPIPGGGFAHLDCVAEMEMGRNDYTDRERGGES